jgi:hypothetical protein
MGRQENRELLALQAAHVQNVCKSVQYVVSEYLTPKRNPKPYYSNQSISKFSKYFLWDSAC